MAAPATFRVNQVSGAIVSSAMRVHSLLGPGLLESAYQACLAHELRKRSLIVASQVGLPVVYDELRRLAADRLAREAPGQTFEATAARLRDENLIADLTVVSVENGPHNIGWTHPEETNAALLEFLSR